MVWIRNSVFFFALVFAQPKKISSSGTKLFSNTIYTFFAPLVLVSVLTTFTTVLLVGNRQKSESLSKSSEVKVKSKIKIRVGQQQPTAT
jgi:hypothetical protein